ncbi:FK506-binding protein 2-like isoform X2 [Gigantopelta aegis]|uniref:FK506-binding protein 2-like isoform X2 n=1 Tax=Gigantopelta aegis TaxID=1735272 RepID=UPI001B88BD89|nr:FK506-binding protein 2-like isoform X2 [Gigantopelta aegis]
MFGSHQQFKPEDCGTKASAGDQVALHYTGTLESGVVFDSSIQKNRDPIAFTLGEHTVIKGWEEGIEGMCVGEKRKLTIPPHLAYGSQGRPPVIPADATLIFELELMSLKKKSFEQSILKTAQFLAVPALIVYVIYYLYDKYKKETQTQGRTKEDKRGKKRK